MQCINITLAESKMHIAIFTDGMHYHYAKIVDSFKLPSFTASRTTSVHFRIRHMTTVQLLLHYSLFTRIWVQFLCFKEFLFLFLILFSILWCRLKGINPTLVLRMWCVFFFVFFFAAQFSKTVRFRSMVLLTCTLNGDSYFAMFVRLYLNNRYNQILCT